MWIRLTRKLAERIDGVDISRYAVGDVIDLTRGDAALLIAEDWAEPVGGDTGGPRSVRSPRSFGAQQANRLDDVKRILSVIAELRHRHLMRSESRRAEDRYREERRALHERIVSPRRFDADDPRMPRARRRAHLARGSVNKNVEPFPG